jgi:hypothetical protein
MGAAQQQHRDPLQTAQLLVAIATGLAGLLYYQHRKGSNPGSPEEPLPLPSPTGPAGFGEVAGGTGGGDGTSSSSPVKPSTGQQTTSAGGEEPTRIVKPRYPGEGQTWGLSEAAAGEGQAEWERNREGYEQTHARPLTAGGLRSGAAGLGVTVAALKRQGSGQ